MDLFEHTDYRLVIRDQFKEFPKGGYGQSSKLAQRIGVNSTLISQILNGTKNLTEDQAYLVGDYFSFNLKESYYFVLLVQWERAGSQKLKNLLMTQIQEKQMEAKRVKGRIQAEGKLSFSEQAVYYSHSTLR